MVYKESDETRELKSEIAKEKVRDSEGHFVHSEPVKPQSANQSAENSLGKFLSSHTDYNPKNDDLLNVHVGNPLRKITQLLEDLKKQKAFSFTLKGSLGIVGVVLALSLLGIFGGDRLLCNKGIQSQIGVIKTLQVKEKANSQIPIIGSLLNLFNNSSVRNSVLTNRTILIRRDDSTISIVKPSALTIPSYMQGSSVIVTGNYDACVSTISIKETKSIEPLQY